MIGSRFALPLKMCAGRNLFGFSPSLIPFADRPPLAGCALEELPKDNRNSP
jgi:hypothetical protein